MEFMEWDRILRKGYARRAASRHELFVYTSCLDLSGRDESGKEKKYILF